MLEKVYFGMVKVRVRQSALYVVHILYTNTHCSLFQTQTTKVDIWVAAVSTEA